MSKSAGNVVAPQEVIKQYGAEILRLWVATQDYQDDLRISPAILVQLGETYRKLRNTARFLLSNLYDFDPATNRVQFEKLPELDRWALMRLHNLITKVRRGYEEFDFRQISHELDYFCAVDMSAIYLDVLKDRLYTFRKDSPLRRGSQTVLFDALVALTKLIAPILSVTADEIWDSLPESQRDAPSVHLAAFPQADPRYKNAELEQRWDKLLKVRSAVQAELEIKRREKLIGAPLEAKVVLQADPEMHGFLRQYQQDLPGLFIVSQVALGKAPSLPRDPGFAVEVLKADGKKCVRCWNYRPAVGENAAHPELCDRCVEAVS
jgi:isoleucyl-tRNA synthetase